jgi:NADP-dependent 3-hydroxy acid dehydrogenase YdfG
MMEYVLQIHMVIGDLNDSKVQQAIVSETVQKFGKLDVLVNNAGMASSNDSVVNGTIDTYDEVFRTNVRK